MSATGDIPIAPHEGDAASDNISGATSPRTRPTAEPPCQLLWVRVLIHYSKRGPRVSLHKFNATYAEVTSAWACLLLKKLYRRVEANDKNCKSKVAVSLASTDSRVTRNDKSPYW